ncbi:hypothetical protein K2P97_07425 [bacterium]|nr:hypothetical protein [bacterium]
MLNLNLEDSTKKYKKNYYEEIIELYEKFENKFPIISLKHSAENMPVNFNLSKTKPIHRWFTYKEGFSPNFVEGFVAKHKHADENVVFDPFGGIGTTVLQSSILDFPAFSNDINPMSNFIARVKTAKYAKVDFDDVDAQLKKFRVATFNKKCNPPDNETILNYFSKSGLEAILKVQYWIEKIDRPKTKEIFSLALLSILEIISTHKKDGNGVKQKKQVSDFDLMDVVFLLHEKVEQVLLDLRLVKLKKIPKVFHQSSFDPYTLPKPATVVITSPPYANCFDYSKIYLVELWFGGFFKSSLDQKIFRQSSVVSHVHYKWDRRHDEYGNYLVNNLIAKHLELQELWDKKIPNMLIGYFNDLGKVLHELKPNLAQGATLGFVVGNSVYAGLPVATDIILSEIAISLGFDLVSVESYRQLSTSSQQLKLIKEKDKKYLRESLVTLKWNK